MGSRDRGTAGHTTAEGRLRIPATHRRPFPDTVASSYGMDIASPADFTRSLTLVALLMIGGCGDRQLDSFEGERRIRMTGEVPTGPETHFFLPFEVPEGVAPPAPEVVPSMSQ